MMKIGRVQRVKQANTDESCVNVTLTRLIRDV